MTKNICLKMPRNIKYFTVIKNDEIYLLKNEKWLLIGVLNFKEICEKNNLMPLFTPLQIQWI